MRYMRQRPRKDILTAVLFLGIIGLLVFSSLWAWHSYISTPPYVDEAKYPVRGIDISRHNGEIDFGKVAESGIEFVFIKASEGKNHRDTLYHRNLQRAREAGLKAGAYHFFRFDREGVEQGVNFMEALGGDVPELGLVIDVEKAGNPAGIEDEQIKSRLSSMVEYLHLMGHPVMVYTNVDGYYQYICDVLPGYPLWICGFRENPINAEWTFWQYDHHGRIPGIEGDVDLNTFCGTREEWERYLAGDTWPYAAT